MSKENKPKILERRTKKTSFLKRETHIKVDLNGGIIEETIEHYAKPIDVLMAILDYLLISRIVVKAGDAVVIRWKLPFQSAIEVTATALEEAIRREGRRKHE